MFLSKLQFQWEICFSVTPEAERILHHKVVWGTVASFSVPLCQSIIGLCCLDGAYRGDATFYVRQQVFNKRVFLSGEKKKGAWWAISASLHSSWEMTTPDSKGDLGKAAILWPVNYSFHTVHNEKSVLLTHRKEHFLRRPCISQFVSTLHPFMLNSGKFVHILAGTPQTPSHQIAFRYIKPQAPGAKILISEILVANI